MHKNKPQNKALATLAATLFMSGCAGLEDASAKSDPILCCITCNKPENRCLSAGHGCGHAAKLQMVSPEKCAALGGVNQEAEKGIK